jgi:hypothetical protein
MMDEVARDLGFDDAADMHRCVAAVDLTTPARLAAFVAWRDDDGTKAGLLALAAKGGGVMPPSAKLAIVAKSISTVGRLMGITPARMRLALMLALIAEVECEREQALLAAKGGE